MAAHLNCDIRKIAAMPRMGVHTACRRDTPATQATTINGMQGNVRA